jgi:hypothetical protein
VNSFQDLLAEFVFDVWLIARFAPRLGGVALEGRPWERVVAGLLHRPGFTRRQGPGTHTLFGALSASGVAHEIDAAANGWRGSVITECKATGGGITKADVAVFHFKVMDFYHRKIASTSKEKWWQIMCGTASATPAARVAAISLGVLICDPARLPLPTLVRAAGRPSADLHLPESLLQEIVRLGERALCPWQDRWPYDPSSDRISFQPHLWNDNDIRDLLWLEDELTGCILDLYETRRPGLLERQAMKLIWQVRKAA